MKKQRLKDLVRMAWNKGECLKIGVFHKDNCDMAKIVGLTTKSQAKKIGS